MAAFWTGRALTPIPDRAAVLCDQVGKGACRKLHRVGIGTTQNLTQKCTNLLRDQSPDQPMRSLICLVLPRSVAERRFEIPQSLSPFIQKVAVEFDTAGVYGGTRISRTVLNPKSVGTCNSQNPVGKGEQMF
jgi:hypothetical protein